MDHVRTVVGLPVLALTGRALLEEHWHRDVEAAAEAAKVVFDWLPAYMALDASLLLAMDGTSWAYRGPVLLHHAAVTSAVLALAPRTLNTKTADRRLVAYSFVEFSAQLLTFQYYADLWRLPGRWAVSLLVFAVYVNARLLGPLRELRRGLAEDPARFWNYGREEGGAGVRLTNAVEALLFGLNVVWSWKGLQRLTRPQEPRAGFADVVADVERSKTKAR